MWVEIVAVEGLPCFAGHHECGCCALTGRSGWFGGGRWRLRCSKGSEREECGVYGVAWVVGSLIAKSWSLVCIRFSSAKVVVEGECGRKAGRGRAQLDANAQSCRVPRCCGGKKSGEGVRFFARSVESMWSGFGLQAGGGLFGGSEMGWVRSLENGRDPCVRRLADGRVPPADCCSDVLAPATFPLTCGAIEGRRFILTTDSRDTMAQDWKNVYSST